MHMPCSLCQELMSEENAQKFAVEVPQIGKSLIFKVCPSCQDKAKYCTLHICLGCKSIDWLHTNKYTAAGVRYHVTFQCNNCVTQMIRGAFAHEAQGMVG